MSTENESPEVDLDTFSADFFGQKEAPPEAEPKSEETNTEEKVEGQEPEAKETEEVENSTDDDDVAKEPEDEPEEAPKPKKNRTQERIEGLVKDKNELQRELAEIKKRLEANEAPKPVEQPKTVNTVTPDDKNEDGSDKYPLGEFDPNYIKDFMSAFMKEQAQANEKKFEEHRQQEEHAKARQDLQVNWNSKLEPARERHPDFNERVNDLVSTFADIEPSYGEYLTTTIMGMDNGTDVLYHLASNPDEADKLIRAGATKATMMLGAIEAKLSVDALRVKPTKAPTPPPQNKGTAVAKPVVEADTDDLDAFAKEFFKKRR